MSEPIVHCRGTSVTILNIDLVIRCAGIGILTIIIGVVCIGATIYKVVIISTATVVEIEPVLLIFRHIDAIHLH